MKFKPYSIERSGYQVSAKKQETAEITMYGEIVERRPVDWWTDEPIEGDFIIQSEFLEDLNSLVEKGCKELTLRINSPGGDAGVSIVIHNRLRELQNEGMKVTAVIDGIAMSGGSLIMCACDNVRVNPSSLVMIHKCWSLYFGAYNADDLRHMAEAQDAFDKAQCSIYARKTGLSDTKILHMMSETTYLTGAEAVEKGFANELIEDAEPVSIAASASRKSLYVNGHAYHLPKGVEAPESIETVSAQEWEDIKASVSDTDSTIEKEENVTMFTNLDELRAENAELAATIESEVRAAVSAEQTSAIEEAVAKERNRLAEIDEISSLYDNETVADAKYGNPCTAKELAFREAKKAAQTGSAFMASVLEDFNESGAGEVPSASAQEDVEKTPEQKKAEVEAAVHSIFHKED